MNIDRLVEILRDEASALEGLAGRLGAPYATALDWILNCEGRVVTCGVGKSGLIAGKAAATFASTGTPSFFLHAAEAVHGDLGMVTTRDLVLVYTYSGETDELVRLFPSFQMIGARTMTMTGRPESSAGRLADLVLDVGVDREVCPHNLAPTTSTTAMLAVSDALAVAVMEQRGFGAEDFARFHPAGALGRRLTLRVRDVMRSGDELPMVAADTPVMDVMRTMTSAGAGGAIVGGERLEGFISDGDLRRYFLESESPRAGTARDLMSTSPTTLEPDLLAFEALEVFQNLGRKIGEIVVVEGDRPVGLLVLKDLLRSGLV